LIHLFQIVEEEFPKAQKKVLNHVEPYQPAQNNSEKKCSWREKQNYGYLWKLLKIELPTCEKLFIHPTISLLLQIPNIECTLHTYSSTVEKLKN
jgi:hypothetical protein